ncbi:MAG: hypothetical protein ACI36X_06880 [Bacteroidaceae bacterium]
MRHIRRLLFLSVWFLLKAEVCFGFVGSLLVDARSAGMGGCAVATSPWANPSLYVFVPDESRCATLQYLNRYGVKEMSTYAGMVNFSNRLLPVGGVVSRYGFRAYSETMCALHVYRALSPYVSLGVRADYFCIHQAGVESNKSVFTADVFISTQPVQNLLITVGAFNPVASSYQAGGRRIRLPMVLTVGMDYRVTSSFRLTGQVEKDFSQPFVGRVGMEYQPLEALCVRLGMQAKPFVPSVGVGVHLSAFSLDIACTRHPVLGFSTSCGLSFHY